MGRGRVLVMDDEDFIKDVVGSMLDLLGYEAELASDGAQAIHMYSEALAKGRRYDAIIMDLTIPGGMGGKEAIQDLLRIDPTVKAIVSSGYSNDPIMSNFKNFGFAGVVAKPFQIEDLSNVIEKVTKGTV
jgi:CheY-like chemotaxis protein